MGEVGSVIEQGMEWRFLWRRHLFMWEEEEVFLSLKEDLEGLRLSTQDDAWRWKLEGSEDFSVKSTYKKLEALVLTEVVWTEDGKGVFDKKWKSPTPSKVVAKRVYG